MSQGCTYFIQAGVDGPIKIGSTLKDPRVRLAQLQTSSPTPLRLLAAVRGTHHEKRMHERFAQWRLKGEWFAPHALGLQDLLRHLQHEPLVRDIDIATFRLLKKFHKETKCGEDGMHWAECDALCQSLGWDDWDIWEALVDAARERLY